MIFLNIISFQHVLHLGDGKSVIEWNMKVKIEISICTGLMLNDHSNPYIESTTVLSDKIVCHGLHALSIPIPMY